MATTPRSNDPCGYTGDAVKNREIHVNVRLNAARVYQRDGTSFTILGEFTGLIDGPRTSDLGRDAGWCWMHPIQVKLDGPTGTGLLNFVVFCLQKNRTSIYLTEKK